MIRNASIDVLHKKALIFRKGVAIAKKKKKKPVENVGNGIEGCCSKHSLMTAVTSYVLCFCFVFLKKNIVELYHVVCESLQVQEQQSINNNKPTAVSF